MTSNNVSSELIDIKSKLIKLKEMLLILDVTLEESQTTANLEDTLIRRTTIATKTANTEHFKSFST